MTISPQNHNPDCIFCKIISKQIPSEIIAESEDYIVIQDISPKAPIHYLIIPKKHIKDIASLEDEDCCLAANMFLIAQQISQEVPGAEDFRLVVNNGPEAGQRVFHLHMHFLSGHKMA